MNETPKRLPKAFFNNLGEMRLADLGFVVAEQMFGRISDPAAIKAAIDAAIVFPVPLVKIDRNRCVMELFRCPQRTFDGLLASLYQSLSPLTAGRAQGNGDASGDGEMSRRFTVAAMVLLLFHCYASVSRLVGKKKPRVKIFLPFGSDFTAEALKTARSMGLPLGPSDVAAPNNGGGEFVEYTVSDPQAADTMLTVYTTNGYLMEPNGAAAYCAMDQQLLDSDTGVTLLPFHPSVKADEVEAATGVRPSAAL